MKFNREFWINILIILIVFGITFLVFQIQINSFKDAELYCDEKYGVDNWQWNETTGTNESPKFYIGQSLKCVEKDEGEGA